MNEHRCLCETQTECRLHSAHTVRLFLSLSFSFSYIKSTRSTEKPNSFFSHELVHSWRECDWLTDCEKVDSFNGSNEYVFAFFKWCISLQKFWVLTLSSQFVWSCHVQQFVGGAQTESSIQSPINDYKIGWRSSCQVTAPLRDIHSKWKFSFFSPFFHIRSSAAFDANVNFIISGSDTHTTIHMHNAQHERGARTTWFQMLHHVTAHKKHWSNFSHSHSAEVKWKIRSSAQRASNRWRTTFSANVFVSFTIDLSDPMWSVRWWMTIADEWRWARNAFRCFEFRFIKLFFHVALMSAVVSFGVNQTVFHWKLKVDGRGISNHFFHSVCRCCSP